MTSPTSRSNSAWASSVRPAAAYAETSQNEQARNGCSSPAEPVDAGLGPVAQQQAVAHQVLLDGLDGAEHPRVVAVDEADRREHQQRGVDLGGVVVLGEGVALRVEAARRGPPRGQRSRIRRHSSTGPVRPCSSTARTARSNAAHDHRPRVGEVPLRSPRISQRPWSGSCQVSARFSISTRWSAHALSSCPTPASRAVSSAIITSPSTSVWRCSTAPLPIRTGRRAGVARQVVERRARAAAGRRRRRT